MSATSSNIIDSITDSDRRVTKKSRGRKKKLPRLLVDEILEEHPHFGLNQVTATIFNQLGRVFKFTQIKNAYKEATRKHKKTNKKPLSNFAKALIRDIIKNLHQLPVHEITRELNNFCNSDYSVNQVSTHLRAYNRQHTKNQLRYALKNQRSRVGTKQNKETLR